jgi:hypothetical protein
MSVKDYTFEGRWVLINESYPTNVKRVMLTNGDSIVIGSVNVEGEVIHWLFDRDDMEDYNPVAWMDLPMVNMFITPNNKTI